MAPIPVSAMYSDEKAAPLGTPAVARARPQRTRLRRMGRLLHAVAIAVAVVQGARIFFPDAVSSLSSTVYDAASAAAGAVVSPTSLAAETPCAQAGALVPDNALWDTLGAAFRTDAFRMRAVDWLGGAVRVPTESYDKMAPVGEDPRWEAFGPFHDYLLTAFPQVHTTLALTKVNTYGLVYTWTGSDPSLKPLALMAHQDVVPVDPTTVDKWTHPPYSGHFDGQRVWGRGSMDDKAGLIGVLAAIESLLEHGFAPRRSVVLSFGFDEEASGLYGAQHNAKALLDTYGEGAFAMIVDEGGGFGESFGSVFAVPGVAEKGYLDVRVDIHTPGGHSSIPPAHTSIGMLSRLLVEYEAHPYDAALSRKTPVYEMVQCFAQHADELNDDLRRAIKKSVKSDKALKQAEEAILKEPFLKALIGTTQAIDLIQGGVKSNALPEQAWAVVNHRIDTASNLRAVQEHDTKLLQSLAEKFNLSLTAFGKRFGDADAPAYGTIELSDAWGTALEPAPVTPTSGKPYALLSGTIKATYDKHREDEKNFKDIFVAPGIMTGNTDTRYYWKLSEHIFRYNHFGMGNSEGLGGVHTVNESMDIDAFVEVIEFFNTLILNVDEADLS